MTLADKIRAARNLTIEVGGMRFFARRPTVEEYGALYRDGVKDPDIARRFITGWEGVRECDLMVGGAEELIAFDSAIWSEAISDMPEVWRAICAKLTAATESHLEAVGGRAKN